MAPPARLRLEAMGPAGGTRLVLATDGVRAVVIALSERRFDTGPATPEALATWTGLPLGPAALLALLAGHPPCPAAVTDDTGADTADPCPGVRFEPVVGPAAGGSGCSGTLHDRSEGTLLARIDCAGGEPGGWPERIRVDLTSGGRSIELRRTDGPVAALLADALFAPAIPAGFRQSDLLTPADSGVLLDPAGDGGR